MKKIRTLFLSALLAVSTSVMADDYQYLTVSQTNGETSFAVSDIKKITFDATNMVLHLSNGSTETLPLANLSKMFFAGSPSAVASLGKSQSKVQFNGGMLRAELTTGERVELFNMKGEKVFSTNQSGNYDLSTLVKGVYIVKVGADTKKVVNK